ncbi:hypothetical protein F2Q70_00014447 [Brassica cretica]|uniref:Uncharacterized protein n=1 Tax=Brassica cretica TaxID=69181 RepID=A0A8S9KNF1_BRACR|nr:hypothetical protein F2Q70_00014447 [Brassica cretica]KAF2595935.1 hypothetical protein F2Q68_00007464 [Brassica cretica]
MVLGVTLQSVVSSLTSWSREVTLEYTITTNGSRLIIRIGLEPGSLVIVLLHGVPFLFGLPDEAFGFFLSH